MDTLLDLPLPSHNLPRIMTPQANVSVVHGILESRSHLFPGGPDAWPIVLLGWRGYYLDTMGQPGRNDRGIYDDAMFMLSSSHFSAYNANTDPSVTRPKVATLEAEQFVAYQKAMHRAGTPGGHMALRQASPVIVRRDDYVKPAGYEDSDWGVSLGNGRWTDRNWSGGIFAINIHKGGVNTTSSLGCQTIRPDLWPSFYSNFSRLLTETNTKRIGYVLINDPRIQ